MLAQWRIFVSPKGPVYAKGKVYAIGRSDSCICCTLSNLFYYRLPSCLKDAKFAKSISDIKYAGKENAQSDIFDV